MPSVRFTAILIAGVLITVVFATLVYRVNRNHGVIVSAQSINQTQPVYVNDSNCYACHVAETERYETSGHSDTFHITKNSEEFRKLDGLTFRDPERGYTYRYSHDEQFGLRVSIEELPSQPVVLTHALGSGQHGQTFVSIIPDRYGDSLALEHRVTAYTSPDSNLELDLTPGHALVQPSQPLDHFGRIIRGDTLTDCISCHTTVANIRHGDIVDLQENVGCQSCHGPGSRHVDARRGESPVSADEFSVDLRRNEIEICGRCHRLPSDPLISNNAAENVQNVRFQPASLMQSKCYQESAELKCTSCHDPHRKVLRDPAHYVQRCIVCHEEEGSQCKVSPASDCIGCHMPAIEVHRGIYFHDHWIRVRSDISGKWESRD